ncbi:MAG: hypothetical protein U5R31_10655 [Acidimicrobiia bacterium]|nr:hypothetical protein [Acidimicrobiia bacterium]
MWLAPERTSPYRFYQYWIQVDDRDVGRFLRQLTLLPLTEIAEVEAAHEARGPSAGRASSGWPGR